MRWRCPRCNKPTLVGWYTDTAEGATCSNCGYFE
jgi:Zn ribbon nucleic-acid-binding protein